MSRTETKSFSAPIPEQWQPELTPIPEEKKNESRQFFEYLVQSLLRDRAKDSLIATSQFSDQEVLSRAAALWSDLKMYEGVFSESTPAEIRCHGEFFLDDNDHPVIHIFSDSDDEDLQALIHEFVHLVQHAFGVLDVSTTTPIPDLSETWSDYLNVLYKMFSLAGIGFVLSLVSFENPTAELAKQTGSAVYVLALLKSLPPQISRVLEWGKYRTSDRGKQYLRKEEYSARTITQKLLLGKW